MQPDIFDLSSGLLIVTLKHIKPSKLSPIISSDRFPNINYSGKLCLTDVPLSRANYWSILAYNQSKLCNMLFAMELNRRLESRGVTCNAVHPGNMIFTRLPRSSWMYWFLFCSTVTSLKSQVLARRCRFWRYESIDCPASCLHVIS